MTHLTPIANQGSAISAAELIAAVDLGSNSFHLVIARIVDGALQLLHREKQKVQLADGLDEQQMLSDEAMVRGLNVLAQFADTLQGVPPSAVRVIATYTLRRAKNANSFLHKAKTVFPFPIEVISGQEEARFIYQGVAHFEHYADQRLVMDIGGGSTEFAIGIDFQPIKLASRNMGCVSYAKLFFGRGKITEKRFERAVLQAEQELENIVNAYRSSGWQQAVGTSGTIKTVKDIVAGLGWHPHCIELEHLLRIKKLVLAVDSCELLDLPGLTEDRKLLLAPGLAILIAAFVMLGIEQMVYVDAALREGVLYEMSDRLQHKDIKSHTVQSLVKRYAVDIAHARRVQTTALEIYKQVQPQWQMHDNWQQLLSFAASVFEIGLQINSSSVQRHSAYILYNANLPGFNQEQQQLLACLVRFHRRKIKPEDFPDFYLYSAQDLRYALVIFRLAILLNQKRRDDMLPQLKLTASDNQLQLELPEEWSSQQTVLVADLITEQQFLKRMDFTLECPGVQGDLLEE
jgi:exopolyphosphatase/guanosine-5'-triphosphate,3'-diphosphate pyrophosphatase